MMELAIDVISPRPTQAHNRVVRTGTSSSPNNSGPSTRHHRAGTGGASTGHGRVRKAIQTAIMSLSGLPRKPEQAAAYVDMKRVQAHMRDICERELDGSPNKGPRKKLKVLSDLLGRATNMGARAAKMGHAVEARYQQQFGGKPLEDIEMMETPVHALPISTSTPRKIIAARSLFDTDQDKAQPRQMRVRLRKIGDCDVPEPANGHQFGAMEATQILMKFKKNKVQIKPIIQAWIHQGYIPIKWSAMNDRVNLALKNEGNLAAVSRDWHHVGPSKIASIEEIEQWAADSVGHDRSVGLPVVKQFLNDQKRQKAIFRGEVNCSHS